nr:putative ribonuclease H-like domain-containing protein [Tanacetum cinerariifolium]
MHAVKRIFSYLKGQPTLGLWYPKDSPLELIAYSYSDYAGATLDKKSTTVGCLFLGSRLIFWKYKKQIIMANSTIESEYIAASSCCGQVLWLQNQLLDYGYNFMQTKIHVDNESAIYVVKNPVYHSKTKHIEIRHHFIRDSYEKSIINGHQFAMSNRQERIDYFGATFVNQHNMVAYLEESDDNTEFHQIVDFFSSCSIAYALTQIHAIVDGKAVVISELLVRSDLLFDD